MNAISTLLIGASMIAASSLAHAAAPMAAPPRGTPYINQRWGSAPGPNFRCGPTAMAMILRHYGIARRLIREHGGNEQMNNAELVNYLDQFDSKINKPTWLPDMKSLADSAGLAYEGRRGPNTPWLLQQLQLGRMVVADGNMKVLPSYRNKPIDSGHYILIVGAENGMLRIHDPFDRNERPTTITHQDLANFLSTPYGPREGTGGLTSFYPQAATQRDF